MVFTAVYPILSHRCKSQGASPSLARLYTPASHPLQIRITISEIPPDDDFVLTTADDSACVKLQFENTVAAFAVVDQVGVSLCVSMGMGLRVGQAVGEEMCLSVGLRATARLQLGWVRSSSG